MSQASAGASRTRSKAHNKGRNKARKGPIVRPLSPHLQVWRWHVTMLGSILHRASGAALYAGAALVCAWLAALAAGPAFYGIFLTVIAGPIGLLVWFGLTLSAFYHLASGLRHLLWDTGAGLTPKTASALATLSIWFAVIATLAYWGWLLVAGKVWL